ncbi:putative sulfate exporter family transporter, partial [Clostridioides difficile]|uniref:putative sulfate exporter family transporter n=1 Tax=Clostridioides difficile TaxID=1496 RepID=UPI002ED46F60
MDFGDKQRSTTTSASGIRASGNPNFSAANTVTIIGAYLIGKKLQFSDTSSLMMAGGNAVCGSSAIASIAPSIHAKEEEK